MTAELLFVYGTLRRDTRSEMYRLLARYADFVSDATFQGRLYKIDYYPGVVPSENPADIVHGEAYSLREPEVVLSRLDQYEECGPGFPEPTEYLRKLKEIVLSNGKKCRAWVYIYNWPIENLSRISSGDFLRSEDNARNTTTNPRR